MLKLQHFVAIIGAKRGVTVFRLKELRSKSGMSQSQVAERLGITRQAYNFYENEKREPDLKTVICLADLFSVSTDYLLGRPYNEQLPVDCLQHEKILIKKYRQLSSDAQARIDKLIDFEIFSQNADNAALLEDTGST